MENTKLSYNEYINVHVYTHADQYNGNTDVHTCIYMYMYVYMYVYMHMTCRSQHKVYRRALTGDDGEEEEIVGERDESVVT